MHSIDLQMRFNDIDQMGHVNNAVIMEYFDLGKEAFLSERGLTPEEGDFTVMIVHYDVDFHSQIHYHESVAVETSIEKLGNKSVTMLQRVVSKADGRLCATCRTVLSGYRRSTASSAVIPDDMRQRLLE